MILVTGASGWIGRRVCSFLSGGGHLVVGADLGPGEGGGWTEFRQVDITTDLTDLPFPSQIEAVIHCAGYAHRPNETPEEQRMFYAVNRDGTKHVVDWCRRNGVSRLLYVSSIAFYDWTEADGRCVDEDHALALPTHYAKSKYEGEELVRSSSLDWRIVRLATVFGGGDRANFARMVRAMKKRVFPIPGKGEALKSVIPVEVAAEVIGEFALMDHPPYQLINVGLPDAPSLREITDAYHRICDLPKCRRLPMPLSRGLARGGDLAAKLLGRFPFNSNTLAKLTTNTLVSVDRMLECFPDREFGIFEDYLKGCADYYRGV